MKKFKLFVFAIILFLFLWIVNVKAKEAKIGDVSYDTLIEAINNVKTNDEIVLLDNVDLTSVFPSGSGLYVELPDGITVDLNGFSITSNSNSIKYAGNDFTESPSAFSLIVILFILILHYQLKMLWQTKKLRH